MVRNYTLETKGNFEAEEVLWTSAIKILDQCVRFLQELNMEVRKIKKEKQQKIERCVRQ